MITGVFQAGQTLKITPGTWDSGTITTIQWLKDGNPIQNATNTTYQLGTSDVGRQISAQVTGTKDGYKTTSRNSANGSVKPGVMIIKAPLLVGSAKVGNKISAKVSAWIPGATITYQWLLDGKAIKGATKSTYTLLKTQKGHKVALQVVQKLAGYSTATSNSSTAKVG